MKEQLIIMHVCVMDLPSALEADKTAIEQAYSDAIIAKVNSDISAIELSYSNAMRCLSKIRAYPSGTAAIDSVIKSWEDLNMAGIEAAFSNRSNTGGSYFTLEFWNS